MSVDKKLYTSSMTKKELQELIDSMKIALDAKDEEIARLKEEKEGHKKKDSDFLGDFVFVDTNGNEIKLNETPMTDKERLVEKCLEIIGKPVEAFLSLEQSESAESSEAEDELDTPAGRREKLRRRNSIRPTLASRIHGFLGKIQGAPDFDDNTYLAG